MTVLSDGGILAAITKAEISINPFDSACVEPASYDIHLGNKFLSPRVVTSGKFAIIDPQVDDMAEHMVEIVIPPQGEIIIYPGEFILGQSIEYFTFGTQIAGRLDGRSSLARLGLHMHVTAGWHDPMFAGVTTLEMHNVAPWGIKLRPGMRIAQMCFYRLDAPALRPYGHSSRQSKYQNQTAVTASRIHQDRT